MQTFKASPKHPHRLGMKYAGPRNLRDLTENGCISFGVMQPFCARLEGALSLGGAPLRRGAQRAPRRCFWRGGGVRPLDRLGPSALVVTSMVQGCPSRGSQSPPGYWGLKPESSEARDRPGQIEWSDSTSWTRAATRWSSDEPGRFWRSGPSGAISGRSQVFSDSPSTFHPVSLKVSSRGWPSQTKKTPALRGTLPPSSHCPTSVAVEEKTISSLGYAPLTGAEVSLTWPKIDTQYNLSRYGFD